MTTSSSSQIAALVDLDSETSTPLYKQLYRKLHAEIREGQLSLGMRLPSSRDFANALGVSRNTVEHAYEQLRSEGYIHSEVGSGTYVSETVPERYTEVRQPSAPPSALQMTDCSERSAKLSKEGTWVMETTLSMLDAPVTQSAFRPGVPALDAFPIETWAKLAARRWRSVPREELVYGDPAGYGPLREELAEYLRTAQGVRCESEQVLILSGSQLAFTLTARVLLDTGDDVCVEDPGHPQMRASLASAGVNVHSVPIDEEGFDLSSVHSCPLPRLIGVTPSHQYPLGTTMSLSRRYELLEWSAQNDVWILEDDYDSEFRYSGPPIAALQGLDNSERVLYTGSFSKALVPAMRLGYLVVPQDLVGPFSKMRALTDRCPPLVNQMILTDFIREGHFEQHIRQMRTLYAAQQNALLDALNEHLGDLIEVYPRDAGLHLIGWLPNGVNDQKISARLRDHDFIVPALSTYADRPLETQGLLFGYGGIPEDEMNGLVRQLAEVIRPLLEDRPVYEG